MSLLPVVMYLVCAIGGYQLFIQNPTPSRRLAVAIVLTVSVVGFFLTNYYFLYSRCMSAIIGALYTSAALLTCFICKWPDTTELTRCILCLAMCLTCMGAAEFCKTEIAYYEELMHSADQAIRMNAMTKERDPSLF